MRDLAPDLRAFALVGGGEGLIQQDQAVGGHLVHDRAHPAQLLVELAALEARVLLAPEMGEHARSDVGSKRLGRHEHAALHHQVGEPEASQEGRLATPVGPGDDEEGLAVRVDVVADDPSRNAQAQADVVQPPGEECWRSARLRLGPADRLALAGERLGQVEAADVERGLRP